MTCHPTAAPSARVATSPTARQATRTHLRSRLHTRAAPLRAPGPERQNLPSQAPPHLRRHHYGRLRLHLGRGPARNPGLPRRPDALARRVRTVGFDGDTALYRCSRPFGGGRIEIQALKPGVRTVWPGLISFEPAMLGGGRFWQRQRRRWSEDARREEERRMAWRGYRPELEWQRSVLFEVARRWRRPSVVEQGASWASLRSFYEWRSGEGKTLAIGSVQVDDEDIHRLDLIETDEDASSRTHIGNLELGAQAMKEALITCWTGRLWVSGNILVDS